MNRIHNLQIALEKLEWLKVALGQAQVYSYDVTLDRMRRELTAELHEAEREGTESIAEYRR